MEKAVIIIPALNPDDRMIEYCESLIENGFSRIIVIDDGSDDEHCYIFDTLKSKTEIVCFRHAVNLGKGRALKNALNIFLNFEDSKDYPGVITVDSDGQHSVRDVIRLSEALSEEPDKLILGVRDFDAVGVPPKSKFGNKCTRILFRLLYGVRIQDTQTGLRAIPSELIPQFVDLKGERFEYEMGVLIAAAHKNIKIKELPIETIYENDNKGTHFNPIRDSLAIYSLLLGSFVKYIFSSFISFLIDIALFRIALNILGSLGALINSRILIATIFSRIISSLFNYTLNKNVVFKSNGKNKELLVKYYLLCAIQMGCSAGLVTLLYFLFPISETLIKIVVDSVLFVISYKIQNKYIFRESK